MFCNLLQGEATTHDVVQDYELEPRVNFLSVVRQTVKVLVQRKNTYLFYVVGIILLEET